MNSPKNTQQTSSLRQHIREQRRQLSKLEQKQHSETIIQHLLRSRLYQYAQHIALYIANDGEIDLSSLMTKLLRDNKKVYLPIILSTKNATMSFAAYTKETLLEKNGFGILEPVYDKQHLIPIEQLDLILAPLVGFDESGNRMGMGGGFYDRALQHIKQGVSQTQFFGIAHELQKIEQLEAQKWDIPLNGVITEERLSYF